MHDYMRQLKKKGWTGKKVAERWGITPRRLSQISKEPTQKDWDALAGLPDLVKKEC